MNHFGNPGQLLQKMAKINGDGVSVHYFNRELNSKKEDAPKEKVPALVRLEIGQVKILAWKTSHKKFSTDRMLDEAILKQAFNGSTSFYKSDPYF